VNAPQDCPEDQADAFLRKYPELREKRLFLFLSRIHAKKGCDLLVEAFAGAARTDPAVHLVMAGPSDPPEWAETLKARADELGIGHRITWTGMLKGHDKWSAFRAAEVFILPTHQENFGIAITEALGCGTPVLITHGVNIWREIESDAAGIVAPPGAEGTRQLLERWLALGASARQAMRRSAACCFAKRFDSEHAAAVLIDTLKKHGVG
jgi:glycosyltransferase involved in cell wall biosynthesis